MSDTSMADWISYGPSRVPAVRAIGGQDFGRIIDRRTQELRTGLQVGRQELPPPAPGSAISEQSASAQLWLSLCAAVTMLRLDQRQRAALGETFRELANLFAAALVIGQLVVAQSPSWSLIATGAGFWTALVAAGVLLAREQRW